MLESHLSRATPAWPAGVSPDFRPRRAYDPTAALLDVIGPVDALQILVIGTDTVDIMCALMRRRCAGVASVRPCRCLHAPAADLALIPQIGSAEAAGLAILTARRAMAPIGGLVLQFAPNAGTAAVRQARAQLVEQGFDAGRSRQLRNQTILFAGLLPGLGTTQA